MIDNNDNSTNTKQDYRNMVNAMGKKEFTLLKMQEYGFWPKDLPTPYERQKNETKEQYKQREKLTKEYEKILNQISELYEEKDEINKRLRKLKNRYDSTWDEEKIRKDVAQEIMRESKERRAKRKEEKAAEKQKRLDAWNKKKSENIVFIGKGYSGKLNEIECNEERLNSLKLPIIKTDKELAETLGIEYEKLRYLAYHRDVVNSDNYHRYLIPKKKGGFRNIAAPKPTLKLAQRKILEDILYKIQVSNNAHGFIKEKSVVSGAKTHNNSPELLINMDIKDFFPTITFERVRGMFKSFGYSGYIASLLAMLCTYCERTEMEIKGEKKYVATTKRILPQGSPASPMITNIICMNLDKRLNGLALKNNFIYTRYADDMSFSFNSIYKNIDVNKIIGLISKIVSEEGFKINKEKTKFLRKNNRQSITGVIINNNEIGVPKKWVKVLRAAIYNANKIKAEGKEVPRKTLNEISGMACWLKAVNATRYEKIINDAKSILD